MMKISCFVLLNEGGDVTQTSDAVTMETEADRNINVSSPDPEQVSICIRFLFGHQTPIWFQSGFLDHLGRRIQIQLLSCRPVRKMKPAETEDMNLSEIYFKAQTPL